MHHVSALLVSLTAVFVLSHNAPPQQMAAHSQTTFLSNCFISLHQWPMILYQQTKNGCQFSCKEWAPLISGCIRGVSHDRPGSILFSYLKKKTLNQTLEFSLAKTEKQMWLWNGQMGYFKLYNAWYKSWISQIFYSTYWLRHPLSLQCQYCWQPLPLNNQCCYCKS